LLCFDKGAGPNRGEEKKIRANRNSASQTRTAKGNPGADLERSYQLPQEGNQVQQSERGRGEGSS
jgi:hypothetical protein